MPSEQCLVVKAHNGFLLALSPGLLLIKHLSVSAHYYPACFCFLNPRHSAACRRTTFTGGENEFEWIPTVSFSREFGCFLLIICCHHVVRRETAFVHSVFLPVFNVGSGFPPKKYSFLSNQIWRVLCLFQKGATWMNWPLRAIIVTDDTF